MKHLKLIGLIIMGFICSGFGNTGMNNSDSNSGNYSLDNYRISMMGSSVANGEGAEKDKNGINHGYAYLYDNLLKTRKIENKSSYPFYISNISVNGNNSVDLLNRFDDLINDNGKFVIYGISLGNEGIHGSLNQDSVYNQFRDNMHILIDKARSLGKEVIVMNNYTRGDFDDNDYNFIKRINDEIAYWDVPSVNLLGAIDNGEGLWADGYQNGDDIYHPGQNGHNEFFYAIVPSMPDAMAEGKKLTLHRSTEGEYKLSPNETFEFSPDGTVHSFTLALTVKGNGNSHLASVYVEGEDSPAVLSLEDNRLKLVLPDETEISAPLSPGFNNISISQNYARGLLTLDVNENSVGEDYYKKLVPQRVSIGNISEHSEISIGEIMFYRSSMQSSGPFKDNIRLNNSSLELYVSMTEPLQNKAMSTLEISLLKDNN